jgi:uncharacterized protein
MRYLLLHGFEGNAPGHWQTWLAGRLGGAGHDVAYPDLPDPCAPRLEAWLRALAPLRRPGDVVLCHSLACALYLHHRQRGGPAAERALLVAPPTAAAGVEAILGFFPVPLGAGLVPEARVVFSADDPYCPEGAGAAYAEPLGIEADELPGRGHLNVDSGLGPWPGVEAWAQGAKNGVDA